jgi:ABC-type uncharacterized transport system fused permease/ATPase subunit
MSIAVRGAPGEPPAAGPRDEDLTIRNSLFVDFARMAAGFWASRERNRLMMLAAALIMVISATAYAQIRLNAWSKPFYDALTRKDMVSFGKQLGVFAELAGVLLLLNVAQAWLRETSRVVLREGLVHDLDDRMAEAAARIPPVERGLDRGEPRPASTCRRAAAD